MLLLLDWRALGRVPGLDVVFDLLQAGRHLVVLHPVHLKHSLHILDPVLASFTFMKTSTTLPIR